MKRPVLLALAAALACGAPAAGADLFAASGPWVGEGRLATAVDAPLERGRCRVTVTPRDDAGEVEVTGSCAVAVGMSEISLKLVRGPGGVVRAGVRTGATGEVVQYRGTETATASGGAITLEATRPLVIDGTAYEARVDVTAPDARSFALRQILRAEGETAWRLVAEMTYRPAGG